MGDVTPLGDREIGCALLRQEHIAKWRMVTSINPKYWRNRGAEVGSDRRGAEVSTALQFEGVTYQ
jgi:hypothetical protein